MIYIILLKCIACLLSFLDETVKHTEDTINDRFEKLTGRQATSAQKSNVCLLSLIIAGCLSQA